jgi:hypothetical protein
MCSLIAFILISRDWALWYQTCKLNAKVIPGKKIVKKPTKPQSTSSAQGRHKGQGSTRNTAQDKTPLKENLAPKTLQTRIMEHLADTPVLLASSALSEMLQNTTDQTTRSAILYARIELLRSRTIACRLGHLADEPVTLSNQHDRQSSDTKANNNLIKPVLEEQVAQDPYQAETAEAAKPENIYIQLTDAHLHQGVELPKGSTLNVSSVVGSQLIAMNVAKHATKGKPRNKVTNTETQGTAKPKKART